AGPRRPARGPVDARGAARLALRPGPRRQGRRVEQAHSPGTGVLITRSPPRVRIFRARQMDFAVLGPLRVSGANGAVELNAPKQRALLATLLLAYREEGVSADRLIDVLWGERPPATATKALQVYVSQLRRALGPGQPIVTRASGY